MNLTEKYIQKELSPYGIRHDVKKLKLSIQYVAKKERINPLQLFRLLCFNEPIEGLYTHSYGFHTRTGRYLIESLQNKYYSL